MPLNGIRSRYGSKVREYERMLSLHVDHTQTV
jgi:hypothetical protein